MEASRFGFQTAPAFKFDPTDADLVAHYLLPRAVGVRDPPFAHAIIDDDPASLPPADLFAKHGHGGSHHAFFLQTADDAPETRERGVKGGAGGRWRGQKASVETVTLVHPGGGELDIQYRRSELTYEGDAGEGEDAGAAADTTGWVMHEYQIVSPPLLATVLSRISKAREDQQPATAAAAQN
ncbi:NAC domain-containing protein 18-like [Hordeum vulgare]|nr:NAC domain-containing protein 18-like [Hordeum vulgare]